MTLDSRIASYDPANSSIRLSTSTTVKRSRVSPLDHDLHEPEHVDSPLQSPSKAFLENLPQTLKHFLPLSQPTQTPLRHLNSQQYMKWLLAAYCVLSLVLFSLDLHLHAPVSDLLIKNDSRSAFDDASISQRLSRLFSISIHDSIIDFDPFIIHAEERTNDVVSACIWVTDLFDIRELRSWISRWQGPVSLLITTAAKPGSPSLSVLLHRLHTLSINPPPGLSVHLLRHGMDEQAVNSYLNLARFFALTSIVMLVPAGLSEPPPISHNLVAARAPELGLTSPLILTRTHSTNQSDFAAIFSLSPVVLKRNHRIWCTERPLLQKSRTSAWGVCLWQLWLDSFGHYVVLDTVQGLPNVIITEGMNDRLSGRFKSETCDLVARTLSTLRNSRQNDEKMKMQWLKNVCGKHTGKLWRIAEG